MTLRRALKRLRLKEGDILLVRDHDLIERLVRLNIGINVAILFSPLKHGAEIKKD